jgi:hypothetical protein
MVENVVFGITIRSGVHAAEARIRQGGMFDAGGSVAQKKLITYLFSMK